MKKIIINKHIVFIVLFLISSSFFFFWLVAFYPAIMSPDSLDQWGQSISHNYTDWHPYIETILYVTFFSNIFKSPLSIAFFQILITAGLFSYIFEYFWKNGISKKIIIILFFLFCTSIPVGLYNITLWKDIPFSLSIIALSFFLSKKSFEKKSFEKKDFIILFIFSIGAIFFRHNGIVYLFFIPFILFIFFENKKYKSKIFFTISLLVVFLLIKFIIPNFLSIKKNPFWMNNVFIYHSTVGFYAHQPETILTERSKNALEMVLPKEKIKNNYNILYWNPLFWNKDVNMEVLNSKEFWSILISDFYLHNLIENFNFFIIDKWKSFFIINNGGGYNSGVLINDANKSENYIGIDNNELGLKTIFINKFLNKKLSKVAILSNEEKSLQRLIIWNSFIPIVLLIFLSILSIINKKKYFIIFSMVSLFQFPFLFFLNIAGDWRYFYFFYLTFFISIPMYLLDKNYNNIYLKNTFKYILLFINFKTVKTKFFLNGEFCNWKKFNKNKNKNKDVLIKKYEYNDTYYIVPGVNISGGIAVVLQHANRLVKRGYLVKILSLSNSNDASWFPNQNVEILPYRETMKILESGQIDILIATAYSTAFTVDMAKAKRKIYFVQSDERRFFDDEKRKDMINRTYKIDYEYMTEAKWIQNWLKNEFGHDSYYVPNGIDLDVFKKVDPIEPKNKKSRILIEGAINIPYKGMVDAYNAIKDLDCEIWIVSNNGKPKKNWRYDRFFENVPFGEMNKIYSSCDIFLKMSQIEGFFGPPMEAMACGCAVVVAKVTGYDEYIINEKNALVVESGDIVSAREAIKKILNNKKLRDDLIKNGYNTVNEWTWNKSIELLEKVMNGEESSIYNTNSEYDYKKEIERLKKIRKEKQEKE